MSTHAILAVTRFRKLHVTHPDGTDVTYPNKNQSKDTYAQDAVSDKHAQDEYHVQRVWIGSATVTELRGWMAEWLTGTRSEVIAEDLGNWVAGYPLKALELLDSYAAQGWRLVHVSEDHGVYFGEDVRDESYPTRIRYLLVSD